MPRYKVSVLQIDDDELNLPTEMPFDADRLYVDPTELSWTEAEDLQQVLEDLKNIDIKTLTEFEAYTSDTLESTTSNNWVTKTGYPYITSVKTAGIYVVDFTAEVGQSNANKQVGYRIQWRKVGETVWNDLSETYLQFPQANGYFFVTSFRRLDLDVDSAIEIRVQWGQTDDGGAGRIRYAGIKLGKVAENP